MAEPDLEPIALDCIARLESEGDSALAAVCAQHPEHADALRAMVAQLRRVGLLPPGAEPAPERIGSYRLLRQIGAGGMGVVYLAEDQRLGRRVALKVMRGACLGDARARERFHREVEAVARLEHPGICTLYEAGEVDGVPFLAMRFVDGETLAARILAWRGQQRGVGTTEGRAAAAERIAGVVAALAKVADAVQAAHEHGVIHRDLKPDNIAFDAGDQPVVLDFGLARMLDAAQASLTRSGDQLGTPAYMAPEQVQGDAPCEPRTDVYALGATLYEAATLRPPFDEARREVLYRRILAEEPPDPRTLEPQVGRDLSAVIATAMAKEPRRRYATARELAAELRRVAAGEPVLARHPGVVARTLRWTRRNRAAAVAMLVVSLALVASLLALGERNAAVARLEVSAWLRFAEEARDSDPVLAFQCAREAVRLDPSSTQPVALARMQELLFELPDTRAIGRRNGTLGRVQWSPDSSSVLATGPLVAAALFGADGTLQHEFGHATMAAVWQPDGDQLAMFSADLMVVERYRVQQGKVAALPALPPHHAMLVGLGWGPGGRLLAAQQRGARLYRADGAIVELAPQGEGESWQGAFLPDGRLVAAGAIWSADGERPQPLDFRAHGEHVYQVLAGADFFVTGLGHDNRTRCAVFWRNDGACLGKVEALGADARSDLSAFAVSPDGRRALVASQDGAVWLREADGRLVRWQEGANQTITAARFHPGGILVGEFRGAVHRVDDRLRSLGTDRVRGGLYDLAVDPNDSSRFVTAGADGVVRLWRMGARAESPRCDDFESVRLAVDGDRVLLAGANGRARLIDAGGRTLLERPIPLGYAFPVFAPDGTAVLACHDGTVQVWDLRSDTMRERWEVRGNCEQMPLFGGDSVFLRAARLCYRCSLHGDDEPVVVPPSPCQSLAVTSDGGTVLAGTWGGQVQVMDQSVGYVTRTIGEQQTGFPILALALSPDDRTVLAGCSDGKAYLWEVATGRLLATLTGHLHAVRDVTFAADGRRAATVSMDDQVRVFDLPAPDAAVGELSATMTMPHRFGAQARFLGRDRLVTAGQDSMLFWELTSSERLWGDRSFGVPELEPQERADLRRRMGIR